MTDAMSLQELLENWRAERDNDYRGTEIRGAQT